ncbi:MAG: methyltransferase domain-containing protein [Parvibaculum sp.]|uniref:class I SAM-dependent methyltransferase n=1 Tax=Parvibaculum sp. TaxID=2024848 RepID=UPI0025D5458D|nr:class I SAM-dependent methyltransferase [Parvibaculum sp.]MCE9649649.1 methyltransferase domain-containing protein [Parvibaculum sp.]
MADRIVAETATRFSDEHTGKDREHLIEAIGRQRYFHDMQLGAVRTGSWVYPDEMPPNYHMLPLFHYIAELDLSASRCLDIGTYDGMTAFVLAECGAREVLATCQHDLDRFRLVRALQDYRNIAYFPQTDIAAIAATFDRASFDVIVMSAMLHHLTAPFDAILLARHLLKRHGYLLLESIVVEGDAPGLILNTELEDPIYGVPTLWLPTESALLGMLKLAGFDIVSHTRLLGGKSARERNHERITTLVRAESPSHIRGRSDKTAEVHSKLDRLGPLDMKLLENEGELSNAVFSGEEGPRYLNIWQKSPDIPLQPSWMPDRKNPDTQFHIARDSDFQRLVAAHPNDAFTEDDLYLLAVRYPGELVPEGMTWSLKQLGNLHVVDYVEKFGLRRVLEVGAGFNFYFENHLPAWVEYTTLDDAGFYDDALISLAMSRRKGQTIQGLLGQFSKNIGDGQYDACVSVSVLEHVPRKDIQDLCKDMFRVLRPGGWALHSIDLPMTSIDEQGRIWLNEMRSAGFDIAIPEAEEKLLARSSDAKDAFFSEPLSITMRFYGGYKKSIWNKNLAVSPLSRSSTILVAAYKPL